jgi:hypothetical protein
MTFRHSKARTLAVGGVGAPGVRGRKNTPADPSEFPLLGLRRTIMSAFRTGFASAALLMTGLVLAGCDHDDGRKGPLIVVETKEEALSSLQQADGIAYIFDLEKKSAIFVVNDNRGPIEGARKRFQLERPLDQFPQTVSEKFHDTETITMNQSGGRQGRFVVWRITANDDPLLNGSDGARTVVADPLAGLLCVVDIAAASEMDLSGDCRAPEEYPAGIREVYRQRMENYRQAGYQVNSYKPPQP